jgi:tetratricopeptide (TPR) repeat protein
LADSYYWAPGERAKAPAAYQKAIALGTDMLQVNSRDASTLADVAYYYAMLGDKQAALKALSKALSLQSGDMNVLSDAALVHNQFGETAEALAFLQKAIAHGYPKSSLRVTPNFDNLRTNPRFQKLASDK